MYEVVYILFGAVFTGMVAVALGRILFRLLGIGLCRGEANVLALPAGAACLSVLVFGLAAVGAARAGVFLVVGLGSIGAAAWLGLSRCGGQEPAGAPRYWTWGFAAVLTAFSLAYLFNALAPETSMDGVNHGLGMVARYCREHGFRQFSPEAQPHLPQTVQMLFLVAYAFGAHSAASMVHFLLLLALAAAMVAYGRRFGMATAGLGGALLVFASPVVGIDATSAYVDVAVAGAIFALFCLLQIWAEGGNARWLVPTGLLAGFASAGGYAGLLALPYALGFVGWHLRRNRGRLAKPLALVTGCALLVVAPWLVSNAPTAAMLASAGGLDSTGAPLALAGPVFLLAPLALFALRRPAGRHLLLAAAVFGSASMAGGGSRSLIPALPFLALALAMVLSRWKAVLPVVVLLHCISSWPAVLDRWMDGPWQLREVPVRAALRIVPERRYLYTTFPDFSVAWMIDEAVPAGGKVFAPSPVAAAYTSREVITGRTSPLGMALLEQLNNAISHELSEARMPVSSSLIPQAMGELRAHGIHYLLMRIDEHGADLLFADRSKWGLQMLSEVGDASVYRITDGGKLI